MKVIENIDTHYFGVNQGMTSLYFPKDAIYAGEVIKELTVFGADSISKAPNGIDVVPDTFLKKCTFGIFDTEKKRISKDYTAFNFSHCNLNKKINRTLDYDLSEILVIDSTDLTVGTDYVMPVCFEYKQNFCTAPVMVPTFSDTIEIKAADFGSRKMLMLNKYNISELKEKKIKKITVQKKSSPSAPIGRLALTLREKLGRTFSQVPLDMFRAYATTDDIYFDNYVIDFNNSFIESGDTPTDDILLTFYY